ncbi:SDR family oxidoreductase [Ramlibacter monticola]|uniref:NmrA family NAD(P)-binding protein n=1 Tax=Ramlibacter monticola TaxID=1926872 RepID=A0A937CWI9_9BURK|nr:NAD(P)H-binding protein [Ramlibacter monticola]MBL0395296.1 NmrA family NAD(P)-binding protein [Ramlibacter monticola]
MIGVCDPRGPLGQMVLRSLAQQLGPDQLVAIVGHEREAAWLRMRGLQVRLVDEDWDATLVHSLAGVERLLLLGPAPIGPHAGKPKAMVEAARTAGVHQIVYTSVLHADSSTLPVAAEHRAVEAALRSAGVPHVVLRQGASIEDFTANVPAALEFQAVLGCAGAGAISCASREDYVDAIVKVLLAPITQQHETHELAGGTVFTLPELAAEISRQSGRAIRYVHLPARLYRAALVDAGFVAEQAQQLVDADSAAIDGALRGHERDLEGLIGRRTMDLRQAVEIALEGCLPQAGAQDPLPPADIDLEVCV